MERHRWTDAQRRRYEGDDRRKITSTSDSQGACVCLWNTQVHINKWNTHTRTGAPHLPDPLWQNLPSVHNLISDPCHSIHCAYGWGERAAVLALSHVLAVQIAHIIPNFALSWCWWDWKCRPILILSWSLSVLPLYRLCLQHTRLRSHPLFSKD